VWEGDFDALHGKFVWEGDFDALDMEVPANPLMEFEINSKQPLDVGFPTQISNYAPERRRMRVQRDLCGEGGETLQSIIIRCDAPFILIDNPHIIY
jgi:hypothetical protein